MSFSPVIRPYRPDDHAALYDICVRTAHEGGDSRHIYPDLDLMPSIFAGPYAELAPDLTFVLDNGHRAVGYVLMGFPRVSEEDTEGGGPSEDERPTPS